MKRFIFFALMPALVLLPLAKKFDVVKVHASCLVVMAAGLSVWWFGRVA